MHVNSTEASTDLAQRGAGDANTGWARLDDRIVIRITGDDRESFLHGMCSNDVKAMSTGDVAPGLFLTERAHILADFFLRASADSFLMEIERALWTPARGHLEKFLIADDVEFEELASLAVLDIEGATAAAHLFTRFPEGSQLESWKSSTSGGVTLANLPRFGSPAYTLFGEREKLGPIVGDLSAAGVPELAPDLLDVLRIENGVPRIGVDTDEKTLAVEARLERAFSLSKGCYIGQETLERATAHGSLKKKLLGLRMGGGRAPQRGAEVNMDGKPIGRLTSRAASARFGEIGLAILHHSAWTPGAAVTVRDGAGDLPAIVSDLPFT